MGAKFYVYAYLLLSFAYVALCVAYLNSVTRTASLARKHGLDTGDALLVLGDDDHAEPPAQPRSRRAGRVRGPRWGGGAGDVHGVRLCKFGTGGGGPPP